MCDIGLGVCWLIFLLLQVIFISILDVFYGMWWDSGFYLNCLFSWPLLILCPKGDVALLLPVGGGRPCFLPCFHCGAGEAPVTIGKELKEKDKKGTIIDSSWTIKKAECRKTDAFELWCWRRLLRVLWKAWRSNQSTLREINPEYSLEGLMLKLKLQYFGHLMWRTDWKISWSWERLKAGEGDDRGRHGWMASPTRWTWVWVSSGSWWWKGKPCVLQSMGSQRVGLDRVTELQLIHNGVVSHPRVMFFIPPVDGARSTWLGDRACVTSS